MANYSDIFPLASEGNPTPTDSFISSVSLSQNFLYQKDLDFFGKKTGTPSVSNEQTKWGELGYNSSLKIPSGSWIQINEGVSNFFNGNFTVETWIYPVGISSDQLILSCAENPDSFNSYLFLLQIGTGGVVRTALAGTPWSAYISDLTSSSGVITANAWNFIQVTVNGTNIETRVNNSIATSGNTITGARQHNNIIPYRIGRLGTGIERFFNGYLQGIRLTRSARPPAIPANLF